jgi:carboxymethylenebutenolidase
MIRLTAGDGFELDAWRADPAGPPRGGVVIVQENAGLTDHIRDVANGFAADGYLAIAPAFYDRLQRNLVFGYGEAQIEARRATRSRIDLDKTLLDVAAALAEAGSAGKVAIIGYCWGGSVAWLAAARIRGIACAVSYYGSAIAGMLAEQPSCPVMFHWGAADHTLPLEQATRIAAAHPEALSYVYEAGHAFNNPFERYVEPAARIARERTLAFLRAHVG